MSRNQYPTAGAYQLLHDGALALADVETNGIRIDVPYLDATIARVEGDIAGMEAQILKDEICTEYWQPMFKRKLTLGSRAQLKEVLKKMGYEWEGETKSGQEAMDKSALSQIDLPILRIYERMELLKKLLGTYLKGIKRETVDGVVHPVIKLHTVNTYRSCIAKGTLIEVVRDVRADPKGMPIEQVRVGDHVYCYDAAGELVIRKVLWAGKTGHRRVVRLHWGARGKHGHLDLTPEHLVMMANGNYVQAQHLTAGRDFRMLGESQHNAKVRVKALGRVGDRLYVTGRGELLDHRVVYQQMVGPLEDHELVHHEDRNHLNNVPGNLKKMSAAAHASLHAPQTILSDVGKANSARRQREMWANGERQPRYGEDNGNHIKLSKFGLLRLLALAGGKPTAVRMDYATLMSKCQQHSIDWRQVKDRYNYKGEYASRGLVKTTLEVSMNYAEETLGMGAAKLRRMLDQRGIARVRAKSGRRQLIHNHKITKLEWLDGKVDVYDLEVDECHNFIANELCVHNSAADPNIQNQMNRIPEMAEILRKCYIPRPGRVLVETDCAAHEWRIAACIWRDKNMIAYTKDAKKDIHEEMAGRVYCTDPSQVSKGMRGVGKNGFVFPRLYGSYYISIAQAMWEAIEENKLITKDNVPVKKMLRAAGIKTLGDLDPRAPTKPGTFAHHVKNVEDEFLATFPDFAKKSEDWYRRYRETGGFPLVTGFWVEGLFSKNFCMNAPVQGPAFHCLLWALTKVHRELRRRKMKALIVTEIHDSILGDVPHEEVQDYIELVQRVMTVDLPKAWDWICVPLAMEAEVCTKNWFDKKAWIKNAAGVWGPK